MSEHSEHEWKRYILTKSIFGNALRFAHLEKPEDADRTSMGAAGMDPSDHTIRNRIRFFLEVLASQQQKAYRPPKQ